MPRANWKNASFPIDEIEDLRIELEKEGVKLPPNPTVLDLHRALRKDWKKRGRIGALTVSTESTPAVTVTPESANAPVTSQQTAPVGSTEDPQKRRASELELDILREKNRLATQTYNIENMRRKREYWASVRKGLTPAPSSFQSKQTGTTLSPQIRPRYCPIHGTTHEIWPCPELKQAHEETGTPLPGAGS